MMGSEAIGSEIPVWLVYAVVGVALFVGAAMIAVVAGKYAIHQWFHVFGGPTLSFLGVVLIGLTVYGNVTLKAGEFEAEFSRLQQRAESLQSSLVASREEAGLLRRNLLQASAELASISETVEQVPKVVLPARYQASWATTVSRLRDLNQTLDSGLFDSPPKRGFLVPFDQHIYEQPQ